MGPPSGPPQMGPQPPPSGFPPKQKNHLPSGRLPPAASIPTGGVDIEEYITIEGADPDDDRIDLDEEETVATIGPGTEREDDLPDQEFYSNLALTIPPAVSSKIAADLLRKIDQDKDAREKRVDQYDMALRRTGLGKDAPGGAQFEGASRVVHPMITEACIDYAARIMKELMPISGPVKPRIVGIPTTQKVEKAERKSQHLNWQVTTQIKEARSVLETTFTQVPLGGDGYVLQYWDGRFKRPIWKFIPMDYVFIPFSASDFYSSHRKTYQEILADVDFKQRVEQGLYKETKTSAPSQRPEFNKAEQANQKIEGKTDEGQNLDGERIIYTTMTYLEVTEDLVPYLTQENVGEIYPYILAIDKESKEILSWQRNWESDDETKEPLDHLYEFGFIPWRGAQSIGMGQIIDGLSAAATGALRALLDSAHANNTLSAFVLKGTGISGQTTNATIGALTEIDAGLECDDVRKRIMTPPFNPPSQVLFQLLGFLVETARGLVRTTMDENPDQMSPNTPVGTQLSRVEEGLVVFSSIHARAHAGLNRLLRGLHRLNKMYLPETIQVDEDGREIFVRRSDYEGPVDVEPVSDPTIYSDQQRFYQIQAIEDSAMKFPNLYNIRAIQKRKLALWRVPDVEEILPPQPEPKETNAVSENLEMALGRPVQAFPHQDHMAHLSVLMDFMQNPALGGNPLFGPVYMPLALKHAAEHIALYYATTVMETVKIATKTDPQDLEDNDPKVKMLVDQLYMQASATVMEPLAQGMQSVMPILQAAMQQMAAMAPKPPIDPAAAAIQAATQETQRKGQKDAADHSLDQARLQHTIEKDSQQIQTDQQRNAADFARVDENRDAAELEAQTRIRTTQMDNQTAHDIARAKIESGAPTRFSDGSSLLR
jgi:hypothetical protein